MLVRHRLEGVVTSAGSYLGITHGCLENRSLFLGAGTPRNAEYMSSPVFRLVG